MHGSKNKSQVIIDLTSSIDSENTNNNADKNICLDFKRLRELQIKFQLENRHYHTKKVKEVIDINRPKKSKIEKANRKTSENRLGSNNNYINSKKKPEKPKEIPIISLDSSDNSHFDSCFFNINQIDIEAKREKRRKEIISSHTAYSTILNNNNGQQNTSNNNFNLNPYNYNNSHENNNNNYNNFNSNSNNIFKNDLNSNIIYLELSDEYSACNKSNESALHKHNSRKKKNKIINDNLPRSNSKEKAINFTKKKRVRTRKNRQLENLNTEMTKFCFDSNPNKKRTSSYNVYFTNLLNKSISMDMKKEKEKLVNSNPQNIFMIENFPEYFRKPVFKKFYKLEQKRKQNSFISIYLTNEEIPECAYESEKSNKPQDETVVKENFYSEYTKFRKNKTGIKDARKEENDFAAKVKKKRFSASQLAKEENDKKSFLKAENEFYEKIGMKKVWDPSFARHKMISKFFSIIFIVNYINILNYIFVAGFLNEAERLWPLNDLMFREDLILMFLRKMNNDFDFVLNYLRRKNKHLLDFIKGKCLFYFIFKFY